MTIQTLGRFVDPSGEIPSIVYLIGTQYDEIKSICGEFDHTPDPIMPLKFHAKDGTWGKYIHLLLEPLLNAKKQDFQTITDTLPKQSLVNYLVYRTFNLSDRGHDQLIPQKLNCDAVKEILDHFEPIYNCFIFNELHLKHFALQKTIQEKIGTMRNSFSSQN
jgi:hypothetical protein